MKQLWLLFLILPVILWTSCETETLPSESPQSLAENILSRSNGIESLPERSKILLNARGGVAIEDKIFTYTKGSWSNDNEYQWENANETTYITALHPHDISNLYKEDALKDILIAQDTLSQGETDAIIKFSLKPSKAFFIFLNEAAVPSKNIDLVSFLNTAQFPQPVFHFSQSYA